MHAYERKEASSNQTHRLVEKTERHCQNTMYTHRNVELALQLSNQLISQSPYTLGEISTARSLPISTILSRNSLVTFKGDI